MRQNIGSIPCQLKKRCKTLSVYDIIVNGEENNSQPPFEPIFPLMSSDGRLSDNMQLDTQLRYTVNDPMFQANMPTGGYITSKDIFEIDADHLTDSRNEVLCSSTQSYRICRARQFNLG
jgi:hypothetical protein